MSPVIDDLVPPAEDRPPPDEPEPEEKAATPPRAGSDDDTGEDADVPPDPPAPPDPPDVAEPDVLPAPPTPARVEAPDSLALGPITPDASLTGPGSAMQAVVAWLGDQDRPPGVAPDAPGDPLRIVTALGTSEDGTRPDVAQSGVPLVLPTALEALLADTSAGHLDRLTAAWATDPESGQARVLHRLADPTGQAPPPPPESDPGWDVVDAGAGDSDLGGTLDSLFGGS